ncbi:MAG: tRNA pseudouridine synthase A [Firmicutes bacterium ADurb.Bin193]|nr:MAG: tRNA pseudouridine synthase A [Firmicutes bacterium ADurb.Bin193]
MCFNGSGYHGWQMQKNALSIEEILSSAILKITGEKSVITGCSRTDACVHALYYVCNFKSETSIPTEKIPLALNTALPDDIRVNRCAVLDDSFHARFSALSKTYIYKAYTARIANPFLKDFAYHFPYEIDFEKIKNAAAYFVGSHDFSAFMASGGSQKTTVRTVTELEVTRQGDEIHFTITADGYLYNMVRIIAGTLLYVGIGKIKSDEIPEIIKSGDRRRSGITAGAQGLYLARVVYPDSYGVFKDWPQGRL